MEEIKSNKHNTISDWLPSLITTYDGFLQINGEYNSFSRMASLKCNYN